MEGFEVTPPHYGGLDDFYFEKCKKKLISQGLGAKT